MGNDSEDGLRRQSDILRNASYKIRRRKIGNGVKSQ